MGLEKEVRTPVGLTVSILGLGLIGGSIGLALQRSRGMSFTIVGFDPAPEARTAAVQLGAVHRTSISVRDAATGADVVFLAAPVGVLPDLLLQVVDAAPRRAAITDVGSTKTGICRVAGELGERGAGFVGGHPLSGSERSGIGAADPYLFQNVSYVLTPHAESEAEPVALLERLVSEMGANPLILPPEEHDLAVAAVSHVPHLAAGALVNAVIPLSESHPELLQLAAGGFRDTTRVASGESSLWRDICLSNRHPIRTVLARLRRELGAMEEALTAGDAPRLETLLERARAERARLPKRPKGIALEPLALITQLADRPGSLARVTRLLADRGLNIIDAEILRVREGEGGTLRLGFENPDLLDRAASALSAEGYSVRLV